MTSGYVPVSDDGLIKVKATGNAAVATGDMSLCDCCSSDPCILANRQVRKSNSFQWYDNLALIPGESFVLSGGDHGTQPYSLLLNLLPGSSIRISDFTIRNISGTYEIEVDPSLCITPPQKVSVTADANGSMTILSCPNSDLGGFNVEWSFNGSHKLTLQVYPLSDPYSSNAVLTGDATISNVVAWYWDDQTSGCYTRHNSGTGKTMLPAFWNGTVQCTIANASLSGTISGGIISPASTLLPSVNGTYTLDTIYSNPYRTVDRNGLGGAEQIRFKWHRGDPPWPLTPGPDTYSTWWNQYWNDPAIGGVSLSSPGIVSGHRDFDLALVDNQSATLDYGRITVISDDGSKMLDMDLRFDAV